jgi:predicted thioesterase
MSESALKPGLKAQLETIVCEHNAAPHVPVFSTPSMVSLMEKACVEAVKDHLGPNETTVGYEVFLQHMAATPIGMKVRAFAELTEIKGTHLYFKAQIFDDEKKVGEGTNKRAIVRKDFGKRKQ